MLFKNQTWILDEFFTQTLCSLVALLYSKVMAVFFFFYYCCDYLVSVFFILSFKNNFVLFFAGFGDRLLGEVKKIAPKDIKIRVRVFFFYLTSILKYYVHPKDRF